MRGTNYIVIFILILTVSVAVLLTGLREATKSGAERNEAIFNKRAILMAVEGHLGGKTVKELSDADVETVFEGQVEQVTFDMNGQIVDGVVAEDIDMAKEKKKPEAERMLPFYVFNEKETGDKFYILAIRGNGLWDEIWGNIALESDLTTVAGAAFDHKGETPGLGAEIKDNPSFRKQFVDKKIYNDAGEFVSITVRKGGAKNEYYEVDGISGATVTADGVSEMLERGIGYYQPVFDKIKSEGLKDILGDVISQPSK